MLITINNHQRKFPVKRSNLLRCARQLAVLAKQRTPGTAWVEVSIHLLDDAGIAPVNASIMNHEGATDVITQRYDTCPGEPDGVIGELFVNVERAFTIPCRKGWTAERELLLYIAHGFDHLTGADDAAPPDRARMRRRELAWLRTIT